MKLWFLVLLLLCVGPRGVAATPQKVPPVLPVELFTRLPEVQNVVVSPDGTRVACLVNKDETLNLAVIDLEKKTRKLITNVSGMIVLDPTWVNDQRLVCRLSNGVSWKIFGIDADGRNAADLTKGDGVLALLGPAPGEPDSVVVLTGDARSIAYRNANTGRLKRFEQLPSRAHTVWFDPHGKVRFYDSFEEGRKEVFWKTPAGDWRKIKEVVRHETVWRPLRVEADGRTAYVLSNEGRNTAAVFRFDAQSGEQLEMVFGDDTYDAGGIVFDSGHGKAVGVWYTTDREQFHWIDPTVGALMQQLGEALPPGINVPVSFSTNGRVVIVHASSDRDPGVFYAFDRTRRKIDEIAVENPAIDPEIMSPMQPIDFAAADGTRIHGYVTLPIGREPYHLPLVVLVHDGPFGVRDQWRYSAECQLFANRGYAVLQVNYRGSGGYGVAFEKAARRRVGIEPQTDLADGVRWAIGKGIADPQRVVVFGDGAFSGYLAMASMAFSPELYVAGINYGGITDLDLLGSKTAAQRTYHNTYLILGDRANAADRQRIKEMSPVHAASRIKGSVFMWYCKAATWVQHGYDMQSALKKAGKDVEFVVVDDKPFWFDQKYQAEFLSRVETFLKKRGLPDPNTAPAK